MELVMLAIGGAIGGFLGGFIYAMVFDILHSTRGVIEVDHRNETCQVRLTSGDLKNRRNTRAVFKINHNADLSRDEQGL